MSRRKHIPDDKLPSKPKACSRILLPPHESYTKECLRIARDRASRALQEIIRIRTQLPLLDQQILLFSENEQRHEHYNLENGQSITTIDDPNNHKLTLAELNTLLTELTCILDQAYLTAKSAKGEQQKPSHVKNRPPKHIRSKSISFPFNNVRSIHHHFHPRLPETKPAVQLIRRNELFEVEKG